MAGHDFNFLTHICKANLGMTLVGDFFQHTFDTSRDGSVNKNLRVDFSKYTDRFNSIGIEIDSETLNHSYRCNPTVCGFISDSLGIDILSHRSNQTKVELIEDSNNIENLFKCQVTVKLFFQTHYKYPCYSNNWGASKGEDYYDDVCGTK